MPSLRWSIARRWSFQCESTICNMSMRSWKRIWGEPISVSFWSYFSWARSEEHTSELQSRVDLVCRLLLEKKKKNRQKNTDTVLTTHPTHHTYHRVTL